jgi:hypothetical protein
VAHEHQMHHHAAAVEHGGKLNPHPSCHCAHCAMGCGSACITEAVLALGIEAAASPLMLDASSSRAVAAHPLDPFRPPIRRA